MTRDEYQKYLRSPRWKRIQFAVRFIQRGRCVVCGRPADPMIVHHRDYSRLGAELPEDVIGLCRRCHQVFHHVWHSSQQRQDIATGQAELFEGTA